MGACLSAPCCDTPGSPGNPDPSDPRHAKDRHSDPRHTRQLYITALQHTQTKDPPGAEGQPNPPSPGSDWTMFTPYPKLPPIKSPRGGGGGPEVKKMALMSKEVSQANILAMFDKYRDNSDGDVILAEGIEKFCLDLEVKPEEFIVLALAWKFGAETMCEFTKAEFLQGCQAMKVDSVQGIKSKFPELLAEVSEKLSFKDMYRWTYKFGLDSSSGQRTLPTDMAISLWRLVFSQSEPPVLQRWLEFLEKHTSIRGIPKDTWDMFLNFTEQIGDDLSNYDDTEAWPSLLDDFVEFENDRHNQNVTTD